LSRKRLFDTIRQSKLRKSRRPNLWVKRLGGSLVGLSAVSKDYIRTAIFASSEWTSTAEERATLLSDKYVNQRELELWNIQADIFGE
jgi:hypothetical protein